MGLFRRIISRLCACFGKTSTSASSTEEEVPYGIVAETNMYRPTTACVVGPTTQNRAQTRCLVTHNGLSHYYPDGKVLKFMAGTISGGPTTLVLIMTRTSSLGVWQTRQDGVGSFLPISPMGKEISIKPAAVDKKNLSTAVTTILKYRKRAWRRVHPEIVKLNQCELIPHAAAQALCMLLNLHN